MSGIVELIAAIGNEKINYQNLNTCITSVKEKKKEKCTAITFVTDAMTPNDFMSDNGKVGFVLWVDKGDVSKALNLIKAKEQAPKFDNDATINAIIERTGGEI